MFTDKIEKYDASPKTDEGFTLIELMVVLLIMAILLAIAIPTFLGVSGSANDRAAQSNLNTALTNVKSYFQTNQQSFGSSAATTVVSAMTTQEPSLQWTTGTSGSSGQISVYASSDGAAIVLASESKTGYCWYLIDNESSTAETDSVITAFNVSGGTVNVAHSGTWYGVAKPAKTACQANTGIAQSATAGTAPSATVSVFQGGSGFPAS